MLKIEPGKFDRTRDGRKFGPLVWAQGKGHPWPLKTEDGKYYFSEYGHGYVSSSLGVEGHVDSSLNLISEWQDEEPTGPVRTVTAKKIISGEYWGVEVREAGILTVGVGINYGLHNAKDLRNAAKVLNELAEALEEGA